MSQSTNTILMIRPSFFRMNEQTSVNNYFQNTIEHHDSETIQFKAIQEFDNLVYQLEDHDIHVIVVDNLKNVDIPDSIFPNNWVSFHENGDVGIYPMFAENRRAERREDIFEKLEELGFEILNVIDYTSAEEEGLFLEGTGSVVLDRVNKKAYCALSPRSNEDLFIEFCEDFEYTPVYFVANQTVNEHRLPIYHTNVMMCITDKIAIICVDCIDDKKERKTVLNHLKEDGKEIVLITEKQVSSFAGNMLQVKGKNNNEFLVMSQNAYDSLRISQIENIKKFYSIICAPISTIEAYGGGSVRCMMAEVFLPKIKT